MQNILNSSFVYRFFAVIGSWFGNQWRGSRVIGRFLSPGYGEAASQSSVFTRIWIGFHRLLCRFFEILRLNRLLRGSIFTKPFIWCFCTVVLAPILPTMPVLGLSLVSVGSLLLAFACDREKELAYSPINKYILLFALVYIVSTLTSVTVSGSLFGGSLTTLFILFAIVVQNSVTTRRQLDVLIYAFVLSGAAVSAYGIYQYLFGAFVASGWVDDSMFSAIGIRVYSTLGNPNVLSQYLLLVIPLTAACIMTVKGLLGKLLFIGCFGTQLICMLLTFTRGGWLGLILAAAVFLVMLDRRLIIVGIIGLILLYVMLPEVILDRFFSIGNTEDGSTSFRIFIWLGTLSMLRDYWFSGIGPGTEAYNRVYPLYSFSAIHSPHSHNLYLQIIVETGISGIVMFLVILFAFFRSLFSTVSREVSKSSKIMQIAVISSMVGFLIQGATDYSFYNYRVTLAFWAALGLGVLIGRRETLISAAKGGEAN